jgi:ATP-binding cassette subfamily G (WHITE) protein 2 (SNQ2)
VSSLKVEWPILGQPEPLVNISSIWATSPIIDRLRRISLSVVRSIAYFISRISDHRSPVTDPIGRKIRSGFRGTVPRTAEEMATHFRSSHLGHLNRQAIDEYRALHVGKPDRKAAYRLSAVMEHSHHAPKNNSYTISIPMQVRAVIVRRMQIIKGDLSAQVIQLWCVLIRYSLYNALTPLYQPVPRSSKPSSWAQSFCNCLMKPRAFSLGEVFYSCECLVQPCKGTNDLTPCSALFFGAISAMAEIPALFAQRPIILRHHKAAMYYPFIEAFAHTVVDIPITFIIQAVFCVILYFMVGLQKSASQFL